MLLAFASKVALLFGATERALVVPLQPLGNAARVKYMRACEHAAIGRLLDGVEAYTASRRARRIAVRVGLR